MLAQFSMKNVLSFKDETILDLTSIPAYKEHPYNLIIGTNDRFVRTAAIYGANASGKSNLYNGIQLFQKIVVNSMNIVDATEDNVLKTYYSPFAFELENEPSEYQIVICSYDKEYTYGFEFNDTIILSEWLYKKDYTSNRKSIILERADKDITIGASIIRECDKYKKQIPPETLALTFFSKLSLHTEVFQDVFSEISRMMIVDTGYYENPRIMDRLLPDIINNNKNELIRFLTVIDTGIKDISYENIDKKTEFFTYHKDKDKKDYRLNLYK